MIINCDSNSIVPISQGGTGQTTAAAALSALGGLTKDEIENLISDAGLKIKQTYPTSTVYLSCPDTFLFAWQIIPYTTTMVFIDGTDNRMWYLKFAINVSPVSITAKVFNVTNQNGIINVGGGYLNSSYPCYIIYS